MAKKKAPRDEPEKPRMLDSEATHWMYIAIAMTKVDVDLAINILCRIVEATRGAEIPERFGFEFGYDAERLIDAARKARKVSDIFEEEETLLLYELALSWQNRKLAAQAEQLAEREGA
jgi:hypothetical protein